MMVMMVEEEEDHDQHQHWDQDQDQDDESGRNRTHFNTHFKVQTWQAQIPQVRVSTLNFFQNRCCLLLQQPVMVDRFEIKTMDFPIDRPHRLPASTMRPRTARDLRLVAPWGMGI